MSKILVHIGLLVVLLIGIIIGSKLLDLTINNGVTQLFGKLQQQLDSISNLRL